MPDEPEVQINVETPPAEEPPPAAPAAPVIIAPQTPDPEVTRLAQELGTVQSELATVRRQLEGQAVLSLEELAQLQTRLTALEEQASELTEVEEIDVPAVEPEPASAAAAVPVAAKPERGMIARMFLGR